MNFIAICLHCLDMRDFHSNMRNTPFLDHLRKQSIFIPLGRSHGHNNKDSMNADMTGRWTARFCNSAMTPQGYEPLTKGWLPRTVIEYLADAGYDIFTCQGSENMGTAAYDIGMKNTWLKDQPERLNQFSTCEKTTRAEMIDRMKRSKRFYAHWFIRETHRPWAQPEGLCAMVGRETATSWPGDAFCARKAALEKPDEFAALRRRGLARADRIVQQVFEATEDIKDLVYIVYSNHGEVFDHFRCILPYRNTNDNMIVGVSHGPYPYEVLYANMQMWIIPGRTPRVMRGVGRMIDYAPTILELADVPHDFMDGQPMQPMFDHGTFEPRERFAESGLAETGSGISMVRDDGMKLISMHPEPIPGQRQEDKTPEYHKLAVFDLATDPYEYHNLVDTRIGREMVQWAVTRHAELKQPIG